MRNERIVYVMPVFWLVCFVITNSSISHLAQSVNDSKTESKGFGVSLKRNSPKIEDNAKTQTQEANTAENNDVIKIETTLIINDVLVLDENRNPVKGLTKNDFTIKEDDETQEIEVFTSGDDSKFPRSIVLIIDFSQSQLPYIKTSIEAAKVLVDKLNFNDRMAIVTDNVELLQDFTSDKNLLKEKLEYLKTSALSGAMGESRQFSALMATLNEMFKKSDLRPIIIFQTDGDQLSQLKKQKKSLQETEFSFQDILKATEEKRATVYTIIPGLRFLGKTDDEKLQRARMNMENAFKAYCDLRKIVFKPEKLRVKEKTLKYRAEEFHQQQSAIAEIANFTGGWEDFLEQPEQADKIYSNILSGMNLRYVLGYYPTNQTQDGKIRRLKIEVRNHPEYIIFGRESYILTDNGN